MIAFAFAIASSVIRPSAGADPTLLLVLSVLMLSLRFSFFGIRCIMHYLFFDDYLFYRLCVDSGVLSVKFQSWARPWNFNQVPITGKGDIGSLHIAATKTDIGAVTLWRLVKLQKFSLWRENTDASVYEGRHADVSAFLHGQRIKPLIPGKSIDKTASIG